MHSTLFQGALCLGLVLLGLVSSAPTPAMDAQSFRVNRVAVAGQAPDPRRAMRHSLGKYGFTMPQAVANVKPRPRVAVTTAYPTTALSGSEVNRPTLNDVQYLSEVTVGGQNLTLNFDTGSGDLWVFSSDLSALEKGAHPTVYDPNLSPTFKLIPGHSWSITYGDNSGAAGNRVGTDLVEIGGITTTQAVELASDVSTAFTEDTESQGLVGLAFGKINTVVPTQQKTFFESIQDKLALPVFTANIRQNESGSYDFGRIDSSLFTGDLHYVPVDSSAGFWQVSCSSFVVGNGTVQKNKENSPAILDTGTTLLLVDESMVQGYWTQVPGAVYDENQGGVTYPCDCELPNLRLALGEDYVVEIPGKLLEFAYTGMRDGVAQCFGGMQSNQGAGLQILGDILFKAVIAVFNIQTKAVGFAPHA